MAGRKSDFTLPTLDDLFSTQELRDDAKLSKIRDIPLELIDDFPDHPFKVRDDEDMLSLLIRRQRSSSAPQPLWRCTMFCVIRPRPATQPICRCSMPLQVCPQRASLCAALSDLRKRRRRIVTNGT